ncbi:CDP-glycerol glycerophosphotransferase family protein [Mesobacillus maritimus]|uniref:CDP-glycerol glycerophosphotransferase family protein n=1 Tax=Mesobacillus maritimus TaxID=1643336 RepID=A0ABS7K4E3_9BACI|nr:CDP-glycerol glycerophosphotransferase family protein [Mesobacillus maritimus]MBY0097105.1 CDP-glycerol glycerophosphotransferase family protein [Mesobacillus maritimus]
MVREIAISLYLFIFKCFFTLFNLFSLKDKTTFVVSFGDNSKYVYEEMRRQEAQDDVVFLCKGKSITHFKGYKDVTLIAFESTDILGWFKSVYHLATSKHILVDNYFGFLAVTNFKEDVECIQLWHATGAIKKFGLQDLSIKDRSEKAVQRFLKVYHRFDKVVVGSDTMARIFKEAFSLGDENILRTGIPRTDFFYDEPQKQRAVQTLTNENKLLQEKKVILYAPTYRDNELTQFNLQLNLEKMKNELGEGYIVILRLHPAIKVTEDYTRKYPDFLFDYSSELYDINDLLLISDYLITDYSSISYEYCLLRKPMIFFTYDLEQYKSKRGIWEGFEENLPGPMVMDTESIIELIKKDYVDYSLIDSYAEKWNKYSTGQSSSNLVHYMYGQSSDVNRKLGQ